jgi:hypothetical protein
MAGARPPGWPRRCGHPGRPGDCREGALRTPAIVCGAHGEATGRPASRPGWATDSVGDFLPAAGQQAAGNAAASCHGRDPMSCFASSSRKLVAESAKAGPRVSPANCKAKASARGANSAQANTQQPTSAAAARRTVPRSSSGPRAQPVHTEPKRCQRAAWGTVCGRGPTSRNSCSWLRQEHPGRGDRTAATLWRRGCCDTSASAVRSRRAGKNVGPPLGRS